MTLKNELVKTGGVSMKTLLSDWLWYGFLTEAVVNNVPKLDPKKKDVVVDLSKGQEPWWKEVAWIRSLLPFIRFSHSKSSCNATCWVSLDDNYDEFDAYNGVYKALYFGWCDLKRWNSLTQRNRSYRYTLQQVDTRQRTVTVQFDRTSR